MMNLTKLIDDVQQALAGHEDLRGTKVRMTITGVGADEKDMSISFRVPEAMDGGAKTPETVEVTMPQLIHEAAEMLLGQMDMTQERMAVDQPDGKVIAELNASMTHMAHAISALSNEHRCWEGETLNRLRMMRDVEARNDEIMRRWVDGPCVR